MRAIIKWFKNYKTFDGKQVNKIYFDDAILEVEKALKVIEENHRFWKELRVAGENSNLSKDLSIQQLVETAQKFHMK